MRNILFIFLLLPALLKAQSNKEVEISIFVEDSLSGTFVDNALVIINSDEFLYSDFNGFVKYKTTKQNNVISVVHIGYDKFISMYEFNSDTSITIKLPPKNVFLQNINISQNRFKVSNGKIEIAGELIRKSPSILGVSDPMRYLQTLSGVNFVSDLSSSIYVRGGDHDQTWVRIDGVPIYNSSHLYGFSSILNASAIQSLTLFKSNLPSDFGTRGSALLDVKLQHGALKKFSADFEIGILNTAFNISVPIIKDRLSYSTNFRTGYPFLIAGLFNEDAKKVDFYYYDWYHKLYYDFKNNKKLAVTVINYADKFGNDDINLGLSPYGQLQHWKSLSTVASYYGLNKFKNAFELKMGYTMYNEKDFIMELYDDPNSFRELKREIFSKTGNIQTVFSNGIWNINSSNGWKFDYGFNAEYTNNKPYQIKTIAPDSFIMNYNSKNQNLFNTDIFLFASKQINDKSKLRFGSRINMVNSLDDENKTFFIPEPRVYYSYDFNNVTSLNLSYERSTLLQSAISPFLINWVTDFWFLSGTELSPQIANQFSAGFLKKYKKNSLNTEVYFKQINNVPDFKEGVEFLIDYDFFEQIVGVKSLNYGIELDHEYSTNKLVWRNSLTLSKSKRYHPDINDGKWYNSNYDIPVKFNSNINFKLNKKWEFTSSFILQSGRPYTPYYYPGWRGDINEFRYPIYHRMDVSFFYHKPVKLNSKTQHSWNLSIFNVYNRLNPLSAYVEAGHLKGYTLFPIMPSFNYILKIR